MADGDTAPKRLALMDFGNDATAPGMPVPTGAFDIAAERYHLLWLYVPLTHVSAVLGATRGRLMQGPSGARVRWAGVPFGG